MSCATVKTVDQELRSVNRNLEDADRQLSKLYRLIENDKLGFDEALIEFSDTTGLRDCAISSSGSRVSGASYDAPFPV